VLSKPRAIPMRRIESHFFCHP